MKDDALRALVDTRERQIQKARIQFGNRLNALETGADQGGAQQIEIVSRWYRIFSDLEEQLDADIADMVAEHAIYDYVTALKGIGPMLSAKMLSMIDIERAPTVSALWRYAGYGVVDGQRERLVKGEPSKYNARLKTTCYLIGTSFLRCNSPYRAVYDRAKEDYELNRPDWTKAHRHQAAMRIMIKRFLSHLYVVWRELEGLSVRPPYVEEYLGHTHIDTPADYGWPV